MIREYDVMLTDGTKEMEKSHFVLIFKISTSQSGFHKILVL